MLSARHRLLIRLFAVLLLALVAAALPAAARQPEPVTYVGEGQTVHGSWRLEATFYRTTWHPGQWIRYDIVLQLADTHLASLAARTMS